MADIPVGVLKETGIGQKGFAKEPVMMFIQELLDQNDEYKEKLKKYEEAEEEHESELVKQYREDQEAAEKRAKEAEQKLQEAEQKAEEVSKSAEETASQLQEANEKVELLANALKDAQDKSGEDTEKVKQLLEEKKQEIFQMEEDIQKLTSEKESAQENLEQTKEQLATLTTELSTVEGQIFAKDSRIEELEAQVQEQEKELEELKNNTSSVEEIQELQRKLEDSEATIAKMKEQISVLEIKASRTDASAAAKIAGSIIDAAEEAKKATLAEADAYYREKVQETEKEAERILVEADEKAIAAKEEAEEILNAAMENARIQSEEISREAVEQEERVQQLTAFTRNMLHQQLSVFAEQLYTVRSLMEQTMDAVDKTMDTADSAVYDARMQIEDISGVVDEQSEAIMSGQGYVNEEEQTQESYSEEITFAPEYRQEVPEVLNVEPPVEDETVAETIMEVAAEGMQEFQVPKFEAPPKYQELRFEAPPENISQENFAESMMSDFVSAPSLEDNLKVPEQNDRFTMGNLMKDADNATE